MKRIISSAVRDLSEYIHEYSTADIVRNLDFQKDLKYIYKRYHALIVWLAYLEQEKPQLKYPRKFRADSIAYLEEAVSDTCQSFVLWTQGIYKPCLLILRSGIENFTRIIGMHGGTDTLNIKNAYDLFIEVGRSNFISGTGINKHLFDRIKIYYKDLSKHVHTADAVKMALTTAIGYYPRYDFELAKQSRLLIASFSRDAASLLCLMFPELFHKMHPDDFDSISDALTSSTKRELHLALAT